MGPQHRRALGLVRNTLDASGVLLSVLGTSPWELGLGLGDRVENSGAVG